MMHESIMTNIRNTEKKEGKCFAVAWPLRPRKDHDRGHDRNGVRSLGEKKVSTHVYCCFAASKELLVFVLLASRSVVVLVTKERYPLIGYPHLVFCLFLVVCDSTQPFFTDSSDDSTSVLRNE